MIEATQTQVSTRITSRTKVGTRTVLPPIFGGLAERKREQDQRDGGAEEREADDVELLEEVPDFELDRGFLLDGDQAELLRLAFRPQEDEDEWAQRCGHHDGEHAV